mgnify:FL=1
MGVPVWMPAREAPEGVFFQTAIIDQNGTRNVARLMRQGNLWFTDSGMYVYYTPTHYLPN